MDNDTSTASTSSRSTESCALAPEAKASDKVAAAVRQDKQSIGKRRAGRIELHWHGLRDWESAIAAGSWMTETHRISTAFAGHPNRPFRTRVVAAASWQ